MSPPPVTSIGVSPRRCQLVAVLASWACLCRGGGHRWCSLSLLRGGRTSPSGRWGGLGRIREGRLRFLPGLPEPPCTARAAPSFLHPRGSGHLKISSVRQGRSLAVHSGPASLCSARAAQATTVCPGRWGGRWGHPGQPPWESSGSGSPPWVHAGPTVSELGPQAQLRGSPA